MGDPCWSSLFLRGCTLLEGTHSGAICEELQPAGRTRFGQAHGERTVSSGRDPTLEQVDSVKESPPSKEKGVAKTETVCDELTAAPILHPPCTAGARR